MTKTYDFLVSGFLTTKSFICITPPGSEDVPLPGGGKTTKEVAVVQRKDANGETIKVAIIPGTTIRGKLRRMVSTLAFAADGNKPDLDTYLYNTIGGIKNAENEEVFDIQARGARRQHNPVIGLFGAGAPWDPSHLHVSDAIPVDNIQPVTRQGLRADDFARGKDIFSALSDEAVPVYLAQREAVKVTTGAKGNVKDLQRQIAKARSDGRTEEVKNLEIKIDEAKKEKAEAFGESGNSIQMPIAHRAMPPDVELEQKFRLLGVTQEEAGLFFAALSAAFENNPLIGGKVNNGYGEVDGRWSVRFREHGSMFENVGEFTAQAFEPIDFKNVPPVVEAIAAWDAFAASKTLRLQSIKKVATVKKAAKAKKGAAVEETA